MDAEAEKAEEGFSEDGGGDCEGHSGDDGAHCVGDEVSEEDAGGGGADGTGGCDVVVLLELENLAAANTGHVDPSGKGHGDEDGDDARSADDGKENDDEQVGDGVENIADAHHEFFGASSDVGCDGAPKNADEHVDGGSCNADKEGNAGAPPNASEEISAEFISAE